MRKNDFLSALARVADSANEAPQSKGADEEMGITSSMSREDAHEKLREYLDAHNHSKEAIKKVAKVMHAHDWGSLKTKRNGREELMAISTDQNGTPQYSYKQKAWAKVADSKTDPLFIDDIKPEDRDLGWLRFGSAFEKIGSGATQVYDFKDPDTFNLESILVTHPTSGSIEKEPTSTDWVASLMTRNGRRLVGAAEKTPREAVKSLRKKLKGVIERESAEHVVDDNEDEDDYYYNEGLLENILEYRDNEEEIEALESIGVPAKKGEMAIRTWFDTLKWYDRLDLFDEFEEKVMRRFEVKDSADMAGLFGKVMHHIDELVGMLDAMGAPMKKSKKYMWSWFNSLSADQVGKLREALAGIGDSRAVRYKVGDSTLFSRDEIIANPPAWVTDKELWKRAADMATKNGQEKVEGMLAIAVYGKMGGKIGRKTTDAAPIRSKSRRKVVDGVDSRTAIDRKIPKDLKKRLGEALEEEDAAEKAYNDLKLTPLYEYSAEKTKLINEAAERYRKAMKAVKHLRKEVNQACEKAIKELNQD